MKNSKIDRHDEPLDVAAGGAEMGEPIRHFDWSGTPLGPAAQWPPSLKSAVRSLLGSRLEGRAFEEGRLLETQEPDPATCAGAQRADSAVATPDRPPQYPRPRILLADDRADMREQVARALNERYEVQAVTDGLAALNAARERAPDLVLTAVPMPGLDGFGLLAAMRADPRLKTVPVILISTRPDEEGVEESEGGADDVLLPPFSARELLGRVDAQLKIARLRAQAEERVTRKAAVVEGINCIFRETLGTATEEELGKLCLAVAEELTGSAFSFMGEINEETGLLDGLAISARAWKVFTMDDPRFPAFLPPGGFKIHGIYGRVLLDGKGLIANDPANHPHRIGTPQGHPPLKAFLGVPLKQGDKTVGMIGLGNREGGYRPEHLEAAEALAPAIWQALQSKRAEQALGENRARLARELHDAKQLQGISSLLIEDESSAGLYERILDAAMAIMRSDFASIQMLDAERGELRLLGWRNFHPDSAAYWQTVSVNTGTTCGSALQHGQRIVMPDLCAPEHFVGSETRRHFLLSGIAAVQSTPLTARDGRLIGMISTHWRVPHAPGERDLALFDVLARQAADVLERRRALEALRSSEAWLAGQKEAFQAAVNGAPLEESLGVLVRTAVKQMGEEVRCGFYIADRTGRSLRHVTGMPESYAECVDGFKVGPDSLACGLAVYTGQPVVTPDVAEAPLWRPWLWLAEKYDYRGVWSFPIEASSGRVVGTFAMYFRSPRDATPGDHELAALVTGTAAIIISRNQEAEERVRVEAAQCQSEDELRRTQARLDAALEAGLAGTFHWDVERGRLTIDAHMRPYFSLSERAVTEGVPLAEVLPAIHDEDQPRVRRAIAEAVAGAADYEVEYRVRHADGGVRWLSARGRAERDESGATVAVPGFAIDITRIKNAEEALRESELRFRNMADHAPVTVWVTAADGTCTYVSKSWYEFTGQVPDEGLGFGWVSALHPDDVAESVRIFREASARREPFRLEYRLRRKDGEYRWAIDAAQPRLSDTGEMLGYIGSVIDITERKQAEEALREADRRKDEFLAMLAHELRNPLAPILSAAEVLNLLGPRDAKQQWACAVIERQTQHLTHLVDDLLDISRVTQGKITLAREALDLATIINRAVEASRPLIEARRHRLTIALPPQQVRVEGDLTRLVQIVGNLLNNAAKYTEDGGHIRLEAAQERFEALIRVRDDGMGLPAELLPHVFDLFTQADRSLDRSQGGLGIGLTLVRQLVELHGGRVEAKSEGPGLGSEFTVRLPVAASIAGGGAEAAAGMNARPVPQKLRVLVVEDNVDLAKTLAFLLNLDGHETRIAYEGPAALQTARSFRPQVVLCDIGLPRMNGYEIAQRLRAEPEFEQTRLIAISGYGQKEDQQRAKESGFDYHLTKPVAPHALNALLDSLGSDEAMRRR